MNSPAFHPTVRRFHTPIRLVCSLALLVSIAMTSVARADRLLVVSKAKSELAVVDPQTLKVERTIPVGHAPHEVCASADGRYAYVGNYGSTVPGNSISVIDLEAGKEIKRVDLVSLRRPHGMVSYAGAVYFTAEQNAAVARLDPKTMQVDLVLGTGQMGTHMLAIDRRDGRLFTTNVFSGSVSLMNPTGGPGGAVAAEHLTVDGQAEGIALSPDGVELWVGPRTGGAIHVIDTLAGKLVQTLPFDGVPIRLSFSPDGSAVFVSDAKSNALVAFDAKTRAEQFRIATKKTPVGLVVAPDGKRLFVSCAGEHVVQVIDLVERAIVGEIDAGPVPDGLAYVSSAPAAPEKKPGSLGVALEGREDGVFVIQVMPGSAAEKAGIGVGDRVVSIDGNPVDSTQAFVRRLARFGANESVAIVVERAGKLLDIAATLGERPG